MPKGEFPPLKLSFTRPDVAAFAEHAQAAEAALTRPAPKDAFTAVVANPNRQEHATPRRPVSQDTAPDADARRLRLAALAIVAGGLVATAFTLFAFIAGRS